MFFGAFVRALCEKSCEKSISKSGVKLKSKSMPRNWYLWNYQRETLGRDFGSSLPARSDCILLVSVNYAKVHINTSQKWRPWQSLSKSNRGLWFIATRMQIPTSRWKCSKFCRYKKMKIILQKYDNALLIKNVLRFANFKLWRWIVASIDGDNWMEVLRLLIERMDGRERMMMS